MVALCLLLLEVGVRVIVDEPPATLFDDEELRTRDRPFIQSHPLRGFALTPGYENDHYRIEPSGFRASPSAPPCARQIVALGESTTFGWFVQDDETYPAHLQALAAEQGVHLRLINAGVPSYSSSQVLRYLDEVLQQEGSAEAVLVNILWNDIWYSTVVNWYPELLIYQQPPVWLSTALRYSALLRLVLSKPAPETQDRVDRFNARALEQYRQNLRAMIQLAERRGVPLLFVEPPITLALMPEEGLNEFHVRYTRPFFIETAKLYREAMHELAGEHGIPVLDHALSLNHDGGSRDLFIDLLHPTPAGNRLMAEGILASLQRVARPEYRQLLGAANCP